jgi:hypothetical protein
MQTHTDGKPLDYHDKDGWHIMCACGHRVGGLERDDKMLLCPNCEWLLKITGGPVNIVYENRVPQEEDCCES